MSMMQAFPWACSDALLFKARSPSQMHAQLHASVPRRLLDMLRVVPWYVEHSTQLQELVDTLASR